MVKYRGKFAQVFYNNNFAEKEEKYDFQIFSKRISEEIENCDIWTFVTSEGDIKGVNNNIENEKLIDNLKEMQIEQSTINGNNDIIRYYYYYTKI